MKYEYFKNFDITYTNVDNSAKLNITNALAMVQDMMTEYFESFKSDNLKIKVNNNALWVVTKTKIQFNAFPKWKDKIVGRSFTIKNSAIRSEAGIEFRNAQNEIAIVARQEYCVIDIDTRKIRKISTIDYPDDMEMEESKYTDGYLKLNTSFTEDDFVYERMILSSDIDFSNHTNNVVYVRFIQNALSCEYFNTHRIKSFEIHHIAESRENQVLRIYKKEVENGFEFLIKENDREVIRAYLETEKI